MSVPQQTRNETSPSEHVTFRLPADVLAELRSIANENERSLSAEARLAFRAWLEHQKTAA